MLACIYGVKDFTYETQSLSIQNLNITHCYKIIIVNKPNDNMINSSYSHIL